MITRSSFEDALALKERCFSDDLIESNPTQEFWAKPPKAEEPAPL